MCKRVICFFMTAVLIFSLILPGSASEEELINEAENPFATSETANITTGKEEAVGEIKAAVELYLRLCVEGIYFYNAPNLDSKTISDIQTTENITSALGRLLFRAQVQQMQLWKRTLHI